MKKLVAYFKSHISTQNNVIAFRTQTLYGREIKLYESNGEMLLQIGKESDAKHYQLYILTLKI